MALKIMKATVKYQCPSWEFCNEMLRGGFEAGKNICRFCVKAGSTRYCALHDTMLNVSNDRVVSKCLACLCQTKGLFKSTCQEVEVIEQPNVIEPKVIIKSVANNMRKTFKQLLKEGCTELMAIDIAYESIMRGGWEIER